jgi:hypothetical protein
MPKNNEQTAKYLISEGPNGKLYAWCDRNSVHLELESGDTLSLSNPEFDRLWQCYSNQQLIRRNFKFEVN